MYFAAVDLDFMSRHQVGVIAEDGSGSTDLLLTIVE